MGSGKAEQEMPGSMTCCWDKGRSTATQKGETTDILFFIRSRKWSNPQRMPRFLLVRVQVGLQLMKEGDVH